MSRCADADGMGMTGVELTVCQISISVDFGLISVSRRPDCSFFDLPHPSPPSPIHHPYSPPTSTTPFRSYPTTSSNPNLHPPSTLPFLPSPLSFPHSKPLCINFVPRSLPLPLLLSLHTESSEWSHSSCVCALRLCEEGCRLRLRRTSTSM